MQQIPETDAKDWPRISIKWLPIYSLTCAMGGGILTAGVTYWNVEAGLAAAAFGGPWGMIGWGLIALVVLRGAR